VFLSAVRISDKKTIGDLVTVIPGSIISSSKQYDITHRKYFPDKNDEANFLYFTYSDNILLKVF
jgi:hypothetical protein